MYCITKNEIICVFLSFSGGAIGTMCLNFIYKRIKYRCNVKPLVKLPRCEVRVMGKKSINCRNCVHSKIKCSTTCTFGTLAWMVTAIDSAQTHLDICMYLITYPEFANAVIRAKDRGCRVRLITSREKEDTATMMLKIRRAGVMVRTMALPSSELMHMKLVIVDRATIMSGSVNYTVSGFSGNAEEVICYEEPGFVVELVKWFHLLWAHFSYIDRTMAMIKNNGLIPRSQWCLDMPYDILH